MPAAPLRPVARALLLALALLPAGAEARGAAADRATAADLIAPVRPADLLEGRVKEAWIWRHDVLLSADGTARIQYPVALRKGEFKDALGRKSLAVVAERRAGSPDVVLSVRLAPPASASDRWFVRDRPETPAALRVHPVLFRWRGKLHETLPEEFRLRPAGSVSDLGPKDGGPRWISAGDLVAEGESLFARNAAPVFAEAFSDEHGGAARVLRGQRGLEVVSDGVTRGWILPASGPVKDLEARAEVVGWTDGGRATAAVPDRLRRSWWNGRTEGRRWAVNALPGERLYASAGEVYVYRRGEKAEIRICAFPWARASRAPFHDQFGEAYAFHVPHFDRDMGRWSWMTNEPWLVPEWPEFVQAGADVDAFPPVPKR